jgi:hypothetical protein
MPSEISALDVERYRRAWHNYVARRNLLVVVFVGFVPLGILVARLSLGQFASFVMLAVWIAVYLAAAWWLTQWKCPRCGNTFANRLWAQRCISCGLRKDELAAVVQGK